MKIAVSIPKAMTASTVPGVVSPDSVPAFPKTKPKPLNKISQERNAIVTPVVMTTLLRMMPCPLPTIKSLPRMTHSLMTTGPACARRIPSPVLPLVAAGVIPSNLDLVCV